MTSLGLVSSKGALAWRPSYNRVYSLPASVCLTRARRPDGYLGLPRGREVVCLLLSLGRRRWGGEYLGPWGIGDWEGLDARGRDVSIRPDVGLSGPLKYSGHCKAATLG